MLHSDDSRDQELLAKTLKSHATVSDRIRALHAAGWERSKIANALGKRYQHIRNVLVEDEKRKPVASPQESEMARHAPCDSLYLETVLKNALTADKEPLNLSFNASLREAAKRLNLNLSELLERRVIELVKQEAMARWKDENREAIESSNRFVEKHGLWSDGLRQF